MITSLVQLKRDGKLIPISFAGIDTGNLLASSPGKSYVATEDCYVWCYIENYGPVKINNISVTNGNDFEGAGSFFIKKGDTISAERGIRYVYGVKYK